MWIKFRHENSKRKIFVYKEAQAETWKQQTITHCVGQGSLAGRDRVGQSRGKFIQTLWSGHKGLGSYLGGLNMTELVEGNQRMLCQG